MFSMSFTVNPAGPRPSVPDALPWVMISPIRVRSERGVPVSPMIRAKPVSGWWGFDSQ